MNAPGPRGAVGNDSFASGSFGQAPPVPAAARPVDGSGVVNSPASPSSPGVPLSHAVGGDSGSGVASPTTSMASPSVPLNAAFGGGVGSPNSSMASPSMPLGAAFGGAANNTSGVMPSRSAEESDATGQRFHMSPSGSAASPTTAAAAAAAAASPMSSERRQYLKLANEAAFGKLENHLREYVRTIPFRPAPTYLPPGTKPPEEARPSRYNPEFDAVFEHDHKTQDTLNHSASFRYCTQRLAMGFHAPYEDHRRVVDYKDFSKILSVPNPSNYEELDPNVEDLPEGQRNSDSPTSSMITGEQQSPKAGMVGASVAASKFLSARLNLAKKKGVTLRMSASEVNKELARMSAEDAHDREQGEDPEEAERRREAEREEAARIAAQKKKEKGDKKEELSQERQHRVVNMYDLPDWRHVTGRVLVTQMESWKTAKSTYM